jgi:protein gp37
MEPTWARNLRDECEAANIPFFMKQMTARAPIPDDLLVRQFPRT